VLWADGAIDGREDGAKPAGCVKLSGWVSWPAAEAMLPTGAAAGGDATAALASDGLESSLWRAEVLPAGEDLFEARVARVPSAAVVGTAGRLAKT
jgi:hypothetical protein